MWNKSIAVASRCVIICLLVLAVDQVSARNTGEYSCSAVKRLLDTVPAATTQKGEFYFLRLLDINTTI